MCFSVQIDRDIKKIANQFSAHVNQKKFDELDHWLKENPKKIKFADSEDRIYPNYYAPIIHQQKRQRIITPMRYRIRPAGSKEEVPAKFNVFNARLDSLFKRKTWEHLIGKKHCLIPVKSFFEWVEHEGKKKQIQFLPKTGQTLWVAGLYDQWISKDKSETIESFAVITTDPPPEIQAMGHDRCPITLSQNNLDLWLDTDSADVNNQIKILQSAAQETYQYQWV
jgi:putative SOS response-associated peptidase YedK